MAYTPELSLKSSQTLRRIAWALDKPMTESLELLVLNFTMFINREKICSKCRDNSICQECVFNVQKHQVCPKTFQ